MNGPSARRRDAGLRRFVPRPDRLEPRTLLATLTPSEFAGFTGTLTPANRSTLVRFEVKPGNFTQPNLSKGILLRLVARPDGSAFAPTPLRVTGPAGAVKVVHEGAGKASNPSRVLLAEFKNPAGAARSYSASVVALAKKEGKYQLNVSLVGDADGNFRVNAQDIALIQAAKGKTTRSRGYTAALDANLDGVINQTDVSLAQKNLNSSTTIRPLKPLTAALDKASDPDGNRIVTAANVTVRAHCQPGATLQLDLNADGTYEQTAKADASGNASFPLSLPVGLTRYRVRASDSFGQRRTLDSRVTREELPQSVSLSGMWSLSGTDVDGRNWLANLVLRQDPVDSTKLTGAIDWQSDDGLYGREYVHGSYNSATRMLQLSGDSLENSYGLGTGEYQAKLDPGGDTFIDGKWGGGGSIPSEHWTAARAKTLKDNGFAGGIEGFQVSTGATLTYKFSGGDPGGYLQIDDTGDAQATLTASTNFQGTWLSTGATRGLISIDVYLAQAASAQTNGLRFTIEGPGGHATFTVPPEFAPSSAQFQTVLVSLDPNRWTIDAGSWDALLANVTTFTIGVGLTGDAESVWVDNVRLLVT